VRRDVHVIRSPKFLSAMEMKVRMGDARTILEGWLRNDTLEIEDVERVMSGRYYYFVTLKVDLPSVSKDGWVTVIGARNETEARDLAQREFGNRSVEYVWREIDFVQLDLFDRLRDGEVGRLIREGMEYHFIPVISGDPDIDDVPEFSDLVIREDYNEEPSGATALSTEDDSDVEVPELVRTED